MNYENPVIPGFYPDPSVCRVGEDYYLVTSTFAYFPGVPIFYSKDLIHWRQIGHCLTTDRQLPLHNSPISGGIYAPTLRYHNNRFYMTTTNVDHGGHFYVWTEDPAGPWSDPIYVDQAGIDPSLYFDDDGKVYFTSTGALQSNGIYQCEIDIDTGKKLTESKLIWMGTGGKFPEAPHLYRIKDTYYLLCAEGGTEYGHMVTISRSDNPYGPFESCPHNPILSHRSLNHPVHATGHADLIEAHDGSWWAVFLGIRPVDYPYQHHLGRETYLAPVQWTDDGWPIIGDSGVVDLQIETDTLPLCPWEVPPERDDFDLPLLGMPWNFIRNIRPEQWSLSERPGWLVLHGEAASMNDVSSPTFVGRRQDKFNCSASACLDFEPLADGEEAGLTVFMDELHHYEIGVTLKAGDKTGDKAVFLRKRVGSLIVVDAEVRCGEGQLVLTIEAAPKQYSFYCTFPDGNKVLLGTGESRYLSTEVAGGFTGVYIGMYATGNGARSLAAAAFDWFEYK
ncbi:glycoside hydrolase family 43 protein [Paenibacillus fonticola]|uniref:glycoside hydrolase family 43 protein n=1 Tax=Paenibacillus fonticola TaxID=379896 RepID=UPI000376AE1B|nr:glycoside hydrolase family 43 protein [Paenibacillus fonticola]